MLFPTIAGWWADSVVGRSYVMLFSGIVFLVGVILIPLGSFDHTVSWSSRFLVADKTFKLVIYIFGLFLVAVGNSGMTAVLPTIGADQILYGGPEAIQKFFIWYYWFGNVGALVAVPFVVYVQRYCSYFYGYLIPPCSVLSSLIVFLAGKSTYITRPPTANILSIVLKIVKEALKMSREPTFSGDCVDHWLDRAKRRYGGSFTSWDVNEVKKIYRLIPILFTFILYFTISYQVDMLYSSSLHVVYFWVLSFPPMTSSQHSCKWSTVKMFATKLRRG